MTERLLTLDEWREARFTPRGRPSRYTVYRWIKNRRIEPLPIRHGNRFYFMENAEYRSPEGSYE
jgi:hypothetical protein